MKWKPTPLGEVLRHRKGSITIDDATNYKLCRVQLHRRGVVLRQHLRGAEIRTKSQQVCRAGDFLIAEMDAKVGGYGFVPPELDGAIVSSHYFLFEVDTKKLHPPYLEVVSQAEILQQQIVAKGSTNYASVRPSNVLGWQIPLPDVDVQKRIARNFQTIQKKLAATNEEITHQESLLAKLKQAILQEAIQGKLTADWRAAHPDVEPASQLLHRIQAERATLIAAKKLRPEKPLPKITPAEIPFEIPKGWEWCRIGDVCKISSGKGFEKNEYSAEGVRLFQIANVSIGETSWETTVRVPSSYWAAYPDLQLREGDLVMALNRPLLDKKLKVAILTQEDLPAVLYQRVGRFDLIERAIIPWLFAYLTSDCFSGWLYDQIKGVNIPFVNQSRVHSHLFPLPPLAEQTAIVERVESLLTTCRALESEIEHSRTHAAHLLQAVLKEAFAPAAS